MGPLLRGGELERMRESVGALNHLSASIPRGLPLTYWDKLRFSLGRQASGGSDCQRQSVCRRHKTQQFQFSAPISFTCFRARELRLRAGCARPDCCRNRGYPELYPIRTRA